jgi:hypothetical protein
MPTEWNNLSFSNPMKRNILSFIAGLCMGAACAAFMIIPTQPLIGGAFLAASLLISFFFLN